MSHPILGDFDIAAELAQENLQADEERKKKQRERKAKQRRNQTSEKRAKDQAKARIHISAKRLVATMSN